VSSLERTGDELICGRNSAVRYPACSFKYAATLQEKASHATPILIRIDTNSGHGASSLTKALETTGDIYSFIMFNMGLTPRL